MTVFAQKKKASEVHAHNDEQKPSVTLNVFHPVSTNGLKPERRRQVICIAHPDKKAKGTAALLSL